MQAMTPAPVTVYWRRGCPYCARLRRELRERGLPTHEVNIWADPSAAAVVRGYAGGNETVPTVVIGGQGYVNPSADTVLAQARRAVPGLTLDAALARSARRMRMLRRVQWGLVAALVVAGFTLVHHGHPGLGWTLEGAAVAVHVLVRLANARLVRPTSA